MLSQTSKLKAICCFDLCNGQKVALMYSNYIYMHISPKIDDLLFVHWDMNILIRIANICFVYINSFCDIYVSR